MSKGLTLLAYNSAVSTNVVKNISSARRVLYTAILTLAVFAVTFMMTPTKASAFFNPIPGPNEYVIPTASAGMIVNNVSPQQLFDLMTNHFTDPQFYYGVSNVTKLLDTDGNMGPGSKWVQQTFLGETTITVRVKQAPNLYIITGESALYRYIATYVYLPQRNNSTKYLSYNTLVVSNDLPGLTCEYFIQYLDSGDQNIINYFNTTGTILQNVRPVCR